MASQSGVKQDALANYGTNSGTAASTLSTLSPIYRTLASGNDGLTPAQLSNLRTSSLQTLGGATSAAGDLTRQAAATGNVGGYQAAQDDAYRTGVAQQSANELNIDNEDAQVGRENQRFGLGGLSGIYSDSNAAAGSSLKTAASVGPSFWQQLLLQGVHEAGQYAAAGA